MHMYITVSVAYILDTQAPGHKNEASLNRETLWVGPGCIYQCDGGKASNVSIHYTSRKMSGVEIAIAKIRGALTLFLDGLDTWK